MQRTSILTLTAALMIAGTASAQIRRRSLVPITMRLTRIRKTRTNQ